MSTLDHTAGAPNARTAAHSTLVQTSFRLATVRAAAQARVLEARVEAEEILAAARAEAGNIRDEARGDAATIGAQAHAESRQKLIRMTERALDRRDTLIFETVAKITAASTHLLSLANELIANSTHPSAVEEQLHHFMRQVTEMVPEFAEVAVAQPSTDSAWSPAMDDRMAA